MSWHPHRSMLLMRGRALANRISESLLIIPAFMVLGAIALVMTLSRVDAGLDADTLPRFLRLSPEASIQLLSTIAGATITTVGVVFSLIVVSMQLASGQLSAVPPGSVLRLETRVGAFLARGIPLATIWPRPEKEAAVARALQAAVVVGERRTTYQDVDFGLRQLSDIGLRSLSAAVNDPTTAIEVVVRLASILRPLLLTELPPQVRVAENGSTLLRPWDLDHAEYVRHTFEQFRLYAAPHPQVAIALVRSLRMLWEAVEGADRPEAQRELERQLALTLQGCERAGLLPADLEAVREAASHVQDPRREADSELVLPPVH